MLQAPALRAVQDVHVGVANHQRLLRGHARFRIRASSPSGSGFLVAKLLPP